MSAGWKRWNGFGVQAPEMPITRKTVSAKSA
jgi:hypothetical protein